MTFQEIFQLDFLSRAADVSLPDAAIALVLSFIVGLFIFWVYKKTFQGVMYSAAFGLSLMGITMITAFVILAVSSNAVLALVLAGALSLVRLGTGAREPMDGVCLFWAVGSGIVLGTGLVPLALLGSIFIGIILLVFTDHRGKYRPYLLVVNYNSDQVENSILQVVQETSKKYYIKSKTVSPQGVEAVIQVRVPAMETQFVNRVAAIPEVSQAVLVSYNGEYTP